MISCDAQISGKIPKQLWEKENPPISNEIGGFYGPSDRT